LKVLRKEGICRGSDVIAYEVDCEIDEAKCTMKQRMEVAINEACERRQWSQTKDKGLVDQYQRHWQTHLLWNSYDSLGLWIGVCVKM
jgi:hypothetical protein